MARMLPICFKWNEMRNNTTNNNNKIELMLQSSINIFIVYFSVFQLWMFCWCCCCCWFGSHCSRFFSFFFYIFFIIVVVVVTQLNSVDWLQSCVCLCVILLLDFFFFVFTFEKRCRNSWTHDWGNRTAHGHEKEQIFTCNIFQHSSVQCWYLCASDRFVNILSLKQNKIENFI